MKGYVSKIERTTMFLLYYIVYMDVMIIMNENSYVMKIQKLKIHRTLSLINYIDK